MLAVYSGDRRIRTQNRDQDDLFAAVLDADGPAQRAGAGRRRAARRGRASPTVHPNEADRHRPDARLPHRGGRQDAAAAPRRVPPPHRVHARTTTRTACSRTPGATASTPAGLDWMGDGDHDNGFGHEYMLVADPEGRPTCIHNPPRFVAAHDLRAERRLPQRPPQRDHAAARHPPAAARRPAGHRREGHARHQDALRLPEALRRHLRLAHQRHRHGHRLARQRPGRRAGRRDLPGAPPQLRALRRPALADRGDADRRLRADGLRLERAGEGLPPRLPELAATTSART